MKRNLTTRFVLCTIRKQKRCRVEHCGHTESKRGSPVENLKIRGLQREDLEAIVTIDEKVLGERRKDYWERKLEAVGTKSAQTSFAAEVDGKVVGFILGISAAGSLACRIRSDGSTRSALTLPIRKGDWLQLWPRS